MKYELEFTERPLHYLVLIKHGETVKGSFFIPSEDVPLWAKVNKFIESEQKKDEPTHTRVN